MCLFFFFFFLLVNACSVRDDVLLFVTSPDDYTQQGTYQRFSSGSPPADSYLRNRLPSVHARARCIVYTVTFRPIDANDR